MAASADIFKQMDQLFRNQTPEGEIHTFALHRFLASDPAFAPIAMELSRIWDDKMVVEIWRTALPRSAKAPFFKYAGPRKAPAPADIVRKIADVEGYTLAEAEEVFLLLEVAGRADEVFAYYGIDASKDKGVIKYTEPVDPAPGPSQKGRRKKKA